ncbi:MAG: hypothetical protein LOY00_17005 [Methylocaldum sp.]|nr:hypothetical protein [Methylocaldum sp.]
MALDKMIDEFGPRHPAGGFDLLRPGGFFVVEQYRVGIRTELDDLKAVVDPGGSLKRYCQKMNSVVTEIDRSLSKIVGFAPAEGAGRLKPG